jgi:Tetracyclin repressor-like, C-terminal domain
VLRFGDFADLHLLDVSADNNTVVADRLRGMVVDMFGVADSAELARVLTISVEAADAVLKLAFRRDPSGDPEIVAEAERLIHAYLAGRLDT